MAAHKKQGSYLRHILIADAISTQLMSYLDYYAEKSPAYPKTLITKLRGICLPQLKSFPESGSPVMDIEILKNFIRSPSVAKLLDRIRTHSKSLMLKEIILDKNFKILYGYNKKNVVLLAIKHAAKRSY